MNKTFRNALITVAAITTCAIGTKAHAAPSIAEYESALRGNTEMMSGIRTVCVSMGFIKLNGTGDHQVWLRRHLNESGMNRTQQQAMRNVIQATCPGHF